MHVRFAGHDWHLSLWRVFAVLLFVSVLGGIGAFGYQVWSDYRGIRSGEVSPYANRRLESTVSRLASNPQVTPGDLARIIDPKAPAVGAEGADLIIVEFLDYGCPFCRASFEPVRELALANQDRVSLVVRDFPLEDVHPGATRAAMAARCADEQEKFWAYHDKLFLLDQRTFSNDDLESVGRGVGLDMDAFDTCLSTERTRLLVEADQAAGLRAGVQGTPTFFFNGVRVQGGLDADVFGYLIKEFLKS